MNGILYFSGNGKIVGHASGTGVEESLMPGVALLESDEILNGDSYYVANGETVERPASPVTLSDLTLLAVPAGSTLTINGESYDAEGDVELEFPLPGVYRLRVECFPYKDWEGEVVV